MPRPNHFLWKAAEIFLSTAAFFLFTIAVLSPDWAKQSLTFPDREDVVISRGLFQVNIYDGYGTFVSSVYDMQDEIGERVDPYCGASSRPSVFVSQLPLLVGNFSIDPKVFGNASSSYKPTRSDDEFGWCRRKHASQIALMVGILPAVLAPLFVFVSIVCTRVSCRFAMLSILTSIASSICGFVSMCVMGGWIVEAKRAHQLLDIPSESNWSGGMAFACIIIASIFGVASALVVLVDLCTSKKACTRAAAAAAESQPLLPAYRELDNGNVQKVPVYDA